MVLSERMQMWCLGFRAGGRECALVLDDRLREVPKVPQMRLYDTSVYLRFSERGRVRSAMRRELAVAKGSERAALTCFIRAE